MENLHRILQRQLKRTLGDPDSLPEPVQRFLQIVNETYHQADNDRKMLERSLEISAQEISQINSELQAVFQALPDLFLQLDRHGVILNLKNGNNPDYPWLAERFIGKSIAEFPLPHLAHQFDANRVTLREHHTSLTIEQNYTSGDKALFYEARFIPLLEDQTIIIVRDITERKLFEEEQVRLVTKLEEANRAKSQFLANISHEVRTPMNGVCGMLDLALETELNFEQRDYLATANNSARDMLAILNDLLDFSKIEAGKLELEKIEFNLYELIAQLVKQFAGTAHTKDLELAYWIGDNVPVFLIGDPVRLKQVLVNLIGNAIKFTESGEVILQVYLEETSNNKIGLHFSVTDTGIGIPPEKQQLIFDAFSQADGSTSRKFGGTGLGLAISAQLVQKMEGRIWVQSPAAQLSFENGHHQKIGKRVAPVKQNTVPPSQSGGSTFHFYAWFAPITEKVFSPVGLFQNELRGIRVLVVDDNLTNQKILGSQLRKWGMLPVFADSGEKALSQLGHGLIANEPVRMILSDMQMPGMDGLELAREISRRPQSSLTPIILLSSLLHKTEKDLFRDLGIVARLNKPTASDELYMAIVDGLGLMYDKRKGNQAGEELPAPNTLPPLRLLLAEDNPVNQKLAIRLLEKMGHQVQLAENGLEVLARLEESQFDMVLMDIHMPELDGVETTRKIRHQEKGTDRHLPIIALTANAMESDRERFLDEGMDEYVSKPIQKTDLIRALSETVNRLLPNLIG